MSFSEYIICCLGKKSMVSLFYVVLISIAFILHIMIEMLSSHLPQSEIIIYGLVRKCLKLSPFS